jgi:hypothetical protein
MVDESPQDANASFGYIHPSYTFTQDDFGDFLDLSRTGSGAVPDFPDWDIAFSTPFESDPLLREYSFSTPFESDSVLQKESFGTLEISAQSSMSPPSSDQASGSSSPTLSSQASAIPCVWPNCEKSFTSMSAYK